MAIIAQCVRGQGFWEEEGSLSSVRQLRCAEKLEGVKEKQHVHSVILMLRSSISWMGRRVEVIADGLSLWHGAQFDHRHHTRVTIARWRHGQTRDGQLQRSGIACSSADQRGHLPRSRARLVVLAVEVGDRWSQEASIFLRDLAKAQTQADVTHPSRKGPGRLPSSVEFPLVLQSDESFCSLFVGETTCVRHWRGRSSAGCCSERRQVFCDVLGFSWRDCGHPNFLGCVFS